MAKIICDLSILKYLSSQATVQTACFVTDISGQSTTTRAQVWDKAKLSVWGVQANSSFVGVPDSGLSPEGAKYPGSFTRSPEGSYLFWEEKKGPPV